MAPAHLHYRPAVACYARWHCRAPGQRPGPRVRVWYRALQDYNSPALQARQRQVDRLNHYRPRRPR